jgi:solute carrier family 25 protein 34/35
VSNPFEVVKTRLQLQGELGNATGKQYNNVFVALRSILAEEGIRGVQAGLAPAIAFQVAMNGVRLGAFPYWNAGLHSLFGVEHTVSSGGKGRSIGEQSAAVAARLLAGMGAGVVGALIAHPMYLVKNRLQSQSNSGFEAVVSYKYKGPLDAIRTIYRDEGGARALFRGWDAAAMRVGAGSAAQLASYETLKEMFRRRTGTSGVALHAMASACASLVVTACMTPFDVVSTRYMQSRQGSSLYTSPLDCLVKTARAEGIAGLYRGAFALYARLAPHTILSLTFLEQFRKLYGLA